MTARGGRGGRRRPDGRPPQAPGVGANAKRHDLERQRTPGLHGSDLQQGDVGMLEAGQSAAGIRPETASQRIQKNPDGTTTESRVGADGTETSSMQIPDAIDFLGDQNGADFQLHEAHRAVDNSRAMTWLPILRQLASGPGASPLLVSTFINQARLMRQHGGQPATIIDLPAIDDGIEAMLAAGVRSQPEPVMEAGPEPEIE